MICLKPGIQIGVGALVPREQITVNLCGAECACRVLPDGVVFGQNGADPQGLAASDGRWVWLNISRELHKPDHILGLDRMRAGADQRSRILEMIRDVRPSGVIQVDASCKCAMKVRFAEGGVLKGAGRTPGWVSVLAPQQALADAANARDRVSSLTYLAGLARGLSNLHELQIAHGDPFPFNAALTGGECVWIDLNSTEPLDDLNAKLDVLAFFHFTYAGVLLSLDPPLHGVLADALDLFAEKKTDVLLRALARHAEAAAARVAANSAYDAVAVRLLQKNYAQVLEMWSGECGWSARVVFDHIRTYIAYLWNEGQSRSWEYNFALERKRHILAEAEYARTNRDRDRILELEKWGKSLLEAKDWHERRSQKLEQRAAEQEHVIDDLRGWAEKLKEGIQWHKEQLEYVQRESARLSVELDRSLADIAEKQRGIETQAAEIQEMRSGQHAIEARLQRAEDQAESTGHELERLTTENSILAEKVEALSRDNEVKRQEVSRLRDALNSTQERLGHESLLVQQCRESIKACGNKYAEASKKLASTSESYAASESKCRQLAERLASIESSLWWRIRVAATRVVPRAKEPNKNLP